ncbi:ATP-binding cassette domain-containing protein [Pseudoduganella sp. DS3]|uniref:ATP-binding cassette domain-containing protein n=1 Tax=Pseudoduganella guangdongensis TaxID=2692179 RepID=A0A6N9HFQ9_9BURK|nr:ABC transporter ATP-binding protein [Pseudoduganella guangdongensis]MYN02431.1 ATP-binding cassette domain-containing protein [Pseudoduganella guangdongensis]
MDDKLIDLRAVSKRYGAVQAVDGIDLSVGRGRMVGLIGHNGAGKSTLFKMMLGLIEPSAGEVRICGVATGDAGFRDVRRRIGYLPESFVAYDNLTGLELLHLFADLKKVARSACGNVLERVGLAAAAGRRVGGYSKGMRQRLGFAQLLLGAPELVFLDEPTNGLDPDGIHDFYRILHQLRAEGATIVITSHILAEIQERVDELVILSGGKVAAQGTLAQLRAGTSMPAEIRLVARSGGAARVIAALRGHQVRVERDCIRVPCAPRQKMQVLQLLSSLDDAIDDVAIHEPSLEDLFFGLGGRHARAA